MKIINIILICLIFLTSLKINSQNWAGSGTEWYYNEVHFFSNEISYILLRSRLDTIFNGIECAKLVRNKELFSSNRGNEELTYAKGDSIFFYDYFLDTFQMYYNFGAKQGDKWEYYYYDEVGTQRDTIIVEVLKTYMTNINGRDLRSMDVLYTKIIQGRIRRTQSKIIERIGDIQYMFQTIDLQGLGIEANYASGIRCFEDLELGLHKFSDKDCMYEGFVDASNPLLEKNIIYPRIATDILNIRVINANSFQIYNIAGMIEYEGKILKEKIDINNLLPSFYIIQLRDHQNKIILSSTFIKI